MSWIDLLGYAASASVLLTFCMSTMIPLRVVAIGSNALFASFGALAHIYPVLVLHVVLLPVNVARLTQALRVLKDGRAARPMEVPVEGLLPFMSRRLVKAGRVLIAKGEKADRLYYLANGKVKIPEHGKVIPPGVVLGEIGIFARDQERTATVVCVDDCEVYEMSESRAKHLFFQDQSFGLALLQLIIRRLTEDIAINQASPSAAVVAPVISNADHGDDRRRGDHTANFAALHLMAHSDRPACRYHGRYWGKSRHRAGPRK
jgi:hypothetical protein